MYTRYTQYTQPPQPENGRFYCRDHNMSLTTAIGFRYTHGTASAPHIMEDTCGNKEEQATIPSIPTSVLSG